MTATATATYTRYELIRTFRNTRFFAFSLAFPLVMFLLIAAPNRDVTYDGGLPLPSYLMAGMVGWGTMIAVMAAGARVAGERQAGWNRQLRITPLRTRSYFQAKVVTGYAMAILTIALLYAAGSLLGVRFSLGAWLGMTALILVGLIPYAIGGLLLGHLLTPDSIGPALGGITALFAVLGGSWGPVATGTMQDIAQCLPSYWLVQAGQFAITGDGWPLKGWIVIALWSAALLRLTMVVYRRDTKRV